MTTATTRAAITMGSAVVEAMAGARDDAAPADEGGRSIVSFTWHARKRSARRNVAPDAVDYVLAHGRAIHRTGVTFYFLGQRDIPPCDRCASWVSRLEGTIVVVAPDGGVITVYRNRRGLRPIIRKMKYRIRERPNASDAGEITDDSDEADSLTIARDRLSATA